MSDSGIFANVQSTKYILLGTQDLRLKRLSFPLNCLEEFSLSFIGFLYKGILFTDTACIIAAQLGCAIWLPIVSCVPPRQDVEIKFCDTVCVAALSFGELLRGVINVAANELAVPV